MYARYTWIYLGIIGSILGFIALLNTLLALSPFFYGSPNESAAAWQTKTHGIASPPDPIAEFKILRFASEASHIKTVVVGSSLILGLDSSVTGPDSYNLGISSYPTSSSIALAQHAMDIAPALRTVYISVDWALGYVFLKSPVGAQLAFQRPRLTPSDVFAMLGDSISLPRTTGLLKGMVDDLANRHSSLIDVLTTGGTIEARDCPDGATAIFGEPAPIDCPGFRDDGSARFDIWQSIKSPTMTLQAALSPGSLYLESLSETGGKPNPVYLDAMAAMDERLKARGGRLVVLVPPLMPLLERRVEKMEPSGSQLRMFEQTLHGWAAKYNITLIDGADSANYGCTTNDFVDAHHAKQSCWVKLFRQYDRK